MERERIMGNMSVEKIGENVPTLLARVLCVILIFGICATSLAATDHNKSLITGSGLSQGGRSSLIIPDTIYLQTGNSVTISSSGGNINEWTGPGGYNKSNVSSITVSPTSDAVYRLKNYREVSLANTNPGFEQPGGFSTFKNFSPNDVPGWQTSNGDPIELWRSGFNGVPADKGSYFAEICAKSIAADLYQDISTTPGEQIAIQFAHRGRDGVDKIRLMAGRVGGPYTNLGDYSDGKSWGRYTRMYTVPAGQTTTRIFYRSISSASAAPASGNFLDDVKYTKVVEERDSVVVIVGAVLPSLTTTAASSITKNSAKSGGNITNSGGASITARGVCWSTTSNPTIGNSKTSNGTGTGSFASSISGLTPGTKYYVRAYATNSVGTAYGNQVECITTALTLPTVTTTAISSITTTTASSGGSVTNDGGASITARGVCWSTSSNPTIGNSKTSNGTGTGSFASSISGLTPGTKYYVRAYATNSVGTAYGNQVEFTTTALVLPTLTTTAASTITTIAASSGGSVINDGGASVTARGVCWSSSSNPTIGNNKTSNGTGAGSFASSISGLTPGTKYYVRAYATNSVGTAYGNQVEFTTTLDNDNDGITDDVDLDDDNDGILDVNESINSNFFWSNSPKVNGYQATGTINGINYTYKSDQIIETTSNVYNHKVFPASYAIPNTTCIKNSEVTSNTLTFDSPMSNPVLVFASIGSSAIGTTVPIQFTEPIEVLWSENVTIDSDTKISGTEGFAIVRINGTFSEISFDYLVAEHYCNFNFGADFYSYSDTDNDGTPDYHDLDSDDDGCPDAIEGAGAFQWGDLKNDESLSGGVDSKGVPLIAGASGQLGGDSYNDAVQDPDCIILTLPTITTTEVTDITINSAVSGGNISSDGNASITARGVCWSTNPMPTTADSKTSNGTGTGSFTSNLTNLIPGTKYYVRAYATNSVGTAYGNERVFTTTALLLPTIATTVVSEVTINSAVSGGYNLDDGNAEITAKGVCWSTSPNPTITDFITDDGNGTEDFASSLTGLTPNTTYYVRAYATNSVGTAYGNQRVFTTAQMPQATLDVTPVDTVYSDTVIDVSLSTDSGNIIVYELLDFDSVSLFGPDTILESGTITISGDKLLKATASGSGYLDNSGIWFYDCELPQLEVKSSLLSGSKFQMDTTVFLHAESEGDTVSGAKIYYVVDTVGDIAFPDSTSGMLYNSDSGIEIHRDVTIYAIAYKNGYIYGTGSWSYKLELLDITLDVEPSDPVVYHFGESIEKISISTGNAENVSVSWILDTVKYSEQESFNTEGTIYNDVSNYPSIDSGSSDTLYLSVLASGHGYETKIETYKYVRLYLPEITSDPLSGTTFTGDLTVELTVADPEGLFQNVHIHYVITTDSSKTVDSANSLYEDGIDVNVTTYIKAIAYADNAVTSTIFTGYYIRKIGSKNAWYKDTDGNGLIDAATIHLSEIPLSLTDSQVVFPDSISFVNPFKDNENVIVQEGDMKFEDSVLYVSFNTEFSQTTGVNTFFEKGPFGTLYGLYYATEFFEVDDSIAPVVSSALYAPGIIKRHGDSIIRESDTLKVAFSEKILESSLTEEGKSRFFDLLSTKSTSSYHFELSVLHVVDSSAVFIVEDINGTAYPTAGDSIRINGGENIAAKYGKVVQVVNENRYAPLEVLSITVEPDVKVLGPIDPVIYEIPEGLKWDDLSMENGIPIVVDYLVPLPDDVVDKLDMRIFILDEVGNLIAETKGKDDNGSSPFEVGSFTDDRTFLVAVWNGRNTRNRIVSSGSYLMHVNFVTTDGTTGVEKKLMVGVKNKFRSLKK